MKVVQNILEMTVILKQANKNFTVAVNFTLMNQFFNTPQFICSADYLQTLLIYTNHSPLFIKMVHLKFKDDLGLLEMNKDQ